MLGGDRPPPPLLESLGFYLRDTDLPLSVSAPNYPRLVRVTTEDVGERVGDNHPLEVIAALARFSDDDVFMEEARAVAGAFGPLSYGVFDFSLAAWKHTALELHVHLGLLRRIGTVAQHEGRRESLVHLDDPERRVLREIIEPLQVEIASPEPFRLEHAISTSQTLEGLRVTLAELYWKEFSWQLVPYRHPDAPIHASRRPSWVPVGLVEPGTPGQLIVRCGSRGWAYQELWRHAIKGASIRVCEGCGALFIPRRKDARHCQDSCRVTSHRRRAHQQGA